jgi:hypothetical protein
MVKRSVRVARAIDRFVDNPVTNLVNGTMLLLIGFSEASRTFTDDLARGQFRVGHGLILIGAFGILRTLPNLIESLEAGRRYMELRNRRSREGPDREEGGATHDGGTRRPQS